MRYKITKCPAIRDGTSAKDRVIICGEKADNAFKQGFRLKHHRAMWSMGNNRRRVSDYDWMNPNLFEQLCKDLNVTTDAKKLEPKALQALENNIKDVFVKDYLRTVVNKFKKVLPELANYYIAKACCGALEKDTGIKNDDCEPANLADISYPDYDTM